MSIYSGFATRYQETLYDETVTSILRMLCRRLLKFYEGEHSDDKSFAMAVTKAQRVLQRQEKHKYLEPKVSLAIEEFTEYLKDKILMKSDAADKSSSKIINTSQKSDKSGGDVPHTGAKFGLEMSRAMVATTSGKVVGVVSATSRVRLSAGHRGEIRHETPAARPSTHHNSYRPVSYSAAVNYSANNGAGRPQHRHYGSPPSYAIQVSNSVPYDYLLSKYLKGQHNFKPNFPQRCFKAFRSKTKRQPEYTML